MNEQEIAQIQRIKDHLYEVLRNTLAEANFLQESARILTEVYEENRTLFPSNISADLWREIAECKRREVPYLKSKTFLAQSDTLLHRIIELGTVSHKNNKILGIIEDCLYIASKAQSGQIREFAFVIASKAAQLISKHKENFNLSCILPYQKILASLDEIEQNTDSTALQGHYLKLSDQIARVSELFSNLYRDLPISELLNKSALSILDKAIESNVLSPDRKSLRCPTIIANTLEQWLLHKDYIIAEGAKSISSHTFEVLEQIINYVQVFPEQYSPINAFHIYTFITIDVITSLSFKSKCTAILLYKWLPRFVSVIEDKAEKEKAVLEFISILTILAQYFTNIRRALRSTEANVHPKLILNPITEIIETYDLGTQGKRKWTSSLKTLKDTLKQMCGTGYRTPVPLINTCTPPGWTQEISIPKTEVSQEKNKKSLHKFTKFRKPEIALYPTILTRLSPFFPLSRNSISKIKDDYTSITFSNQNSWGSISYKGPTLSTYDEDILLATLAVCTAESTAKYVSIVRVPVPGLTWRKYPTFEYRGPAIEILKAMGNKNYGYDRLHRTLLRLSRVESITITETNNTKEDKNKNEQEKESSPRTYTIKGGLIKDYHKLQKNLIVFRLDPLFYTFIKDNRVTYIELNIRRSIKSPIGRAIHRFLNGQKNIDWNGNLALLSNAINYYGEHLERAFNSLKKTIFRSLNRMKKSGFIEWEWHISSRKPKRKVITDTETLAKYIKIRIIKQQILIGTRKAEFTLPLGIKNRKKRIKPNEHIAETKSSRSPPVA